MMRRATKRSTRAANAEEKRFMAWVKQQPCIQCQRPGPSIADHLYGSAFIHNKVLIGHWAIIPLCIECDAVKTRGNHRYYQEMFGETQADSWVRLVLYSPFEPPQELIDAIEDWGR